MRSWLLLLTASGLVACSAPARHSLMFLTRDGCVNTDAMKSNLDRALGTITNAPAVQVIDLDSLPEKDVRRGYPTPTLLHNDVDVFGLPRPQPPLPEPT